MFIPIKQALSMLKSGKFDDYSALDDEFDYFPDRKEVEIINSIQKYRDSDMIDKPLLSMEIVTHIGR